MAEILETLILDELAPSGGQGRWILPPSRTRRLERRLSSAFADPALPSSAVMRLLKLIAVFDEDPAYELVGDAVVEMLKRMPIAVARIECLFGRSGHFTPVLLKRAPTIEDQRRPGLRLRDLRPQGRARA